MKRLLQELEARRAMFAQVAQQVLDYWQQDEEGIDEVYGSGGPCDAISRAFEGVVQFAYVDANGNRVTPNVVAGGHDGDDHAWIIVFDDVEAVGIDIPPHVYEVGGGYSWRKIPGVRIKPSDIDIFVIKRSDIGSGEE